MRYPENMATVGRPGLRAFCAALLLISGTSTGQERDPHDLPPRSAAYSLGVIETADFASIEGRGVRVRRDHLVVRFGEYDWGGFQLGTGFAWEFTRPEFAGVDSRNRDLHRVQIPFLFSREYGSWRLRGYLAPGVSTSSNVLSDLSQGGESDVMVSARVTVAWPDASGGWEWRAGLLSDRRLGSTRLYPAGGLVLDAGSWHWELLLPEPRLDIRVAERQTLSARFYPAGDSWRVTNKFTDQEYTYFIEGWRAELGWEWRAHRSFNVALMIGHELDRRHAFVDDAGIPRDSDVDSAPYASLVLHGFWGSRDHE